MNQYVKTEQDDQMFLVVAQMKNTCNENELLYFNASPVYKFRLVDTYLSFKTKTKKKIVSNSAFDQLTLRLFEFYPIIIQHFSTAHLKKWKYC